KFSSRFFLALVIFASGYGCVLQSTYDELKETTDSQVSGLRGEIAQLNAQRASQEAALSAEKTKLQEEIKALQAQKASLEHDMAGLDEKLHLTEKQAEEIKAMKDEEINRLKGTYDNLVKDLQGEIEKGEIKVTQIRNRLSVNLVEKVLFDSGQAEVKSKGKEILKKVGTILKDIKGKEIRIEGYTDNIPIGGALQKKFPTNWELSAQRATNVLRFLEDEAGVEGGMLSAVGYGPFHPVASNETPQGRAENRRIEILLVPADLREIGKPGK
ncbi:MAG TPA: OmpA family protein, partial [Nitrospiria bacterium]|nr:OmpA family protein [Nitrospiria bacterium]